MKKWANDLTEIFEKRNPNCQKTHKEVLNIPGYRKSNHIKILPHSFYNDYHQKHKE
jgi:hypothetical protein